ncbi:MAG: hypothetical protein IPP41_00020 [Rhodocyclaceae bacterium]|nr:hypothetical protein [Rhodocyclaceae bacterium]
MIRKKAQAGGDRPTLRECYAMRLDPKLQYLAEIAALKQRRTVSNFIEWAMTKPAQNGNLRRADTDSMGPTIALPTMRQSFGTWMTLIRSSNSLKATQTF